MRHLSPRRTLQWRSVKRFAIVMIPTFCIVGVPFLDTRWYVWFTIAEIAVGVAIVLFIVLSQRRLLCKLSDSNGKVCVYCEYSLVDLPASGKCPECGRPFPEDGYASLWSKYIRYPREE